MNVIRSLWASIQGDPVFMRRVNGWFTVFWLVMIPVSLITGWISSGRCRKTDLKSSISKKPFRTLFSLSRVI